MPDRRSSMNFAAAAIVAAALLGACGSSSKSSAGPSTSSTTATTATATSPICQSVDGLRSSLSAFTNGATYTKAGAQAALDNVKSSLGNVKSTVSSGDKPKVDALESSITDFETAIKNMHGLSGIGDVASAGKNVATSGEAVVEALKAGCPSK